MRALAAALAAALLFVLAPAPGAVGAVGAVGAGAAERDARASGVVHQELRRQGASGSSAVHVLRARGGIGVRLRPVLGGGRVGALETVPAMAQRLADRGAVAGTNGGFWLRYPDGEPNGYFADAGRLVSEAETQGSGPRGTVLVRRDGGVLVDRLDTSVSLALPGRDEAVPVTGVNRYSPGAGVHPDGDDPVFAYTPALGAHEAISVSPLRPHHPVAAVELSGLHLPAEGRASGRVVRGVGPGRHRLRPARVLLVGHGRSAALLGQLAQGEQVTVAVQLELEDTDSPGDVVAGLAGGPLILDDGEVVPPAGWYREGFSPQAHGLAPHPRTAVGVRRDGQVLVVTVDGRQPGRSAGMHLADLARLLADLGATDAVSVDGGGSTSTVVDGRLANSPSDRSGPRPVATGLFFFRMPPEAEPAPQPSAAPAPSQPVFERTTVIEGDDDHQLAAEVARAAHPDGADEVILVGDRTSALLAAPLGAARGAPLLLTGPRRLPDATRRALDELAPRRVTVVAPTGVVPDAVLAELRDRGLALTQLGGSGAAQTAVAVAEALGGGARRVFVVAEARLADAAEVVPVAAMFRAPILLSDGQRLPEAALDWIGEDVDDAVLVGGPAVLGADLPGLLAEQGIRVLRLWGRDRPDHARRLLGWAAARLRCPPGTATTDGFSVTDGNRCLDGRGLVVAEEQAAGDALAAGWLGAARDQLVLTLPATGGIGEHLTALRMLPASVDDITLVGRAGHPSVERRRQLEELGG